MENFDIVCDFDDVSVVKGGPSGDEMIMRGWASSPSKDADGERLLQEGLDLTHFREKGWVNWNHQQHEIVGIPTVAELRDREGFGKCLYTEFQLIPKVPMARHIWNLATSLEEMGATRRLGLSIEGKRVELGPKGTVKKASVMGMAVTPSAKNSDTSVSAFIKAMATEDLTQIGRFTPTVPVVVDQIVEAVAGGIRKALDSGYASGGMDQAGGAALRKEAVEHIQSDLVPMALPDEGSLYGNMDAATRSACEALSKVASNRGGKLTKSEAALYVHLVTSKPLDECFSVFGVR